VTYLILGASSFYGSNFCNLLRERGEDVAELSRPGWLLGDEIPWADCVVNFASASLVAESWRDPVEWVSVNAVQTTKLLEGVRALKIPRFVHVSTPEVYGNTPSIVREGSAFNPSTPYAVSRAAADMMMMAYHRAYSFPAIITRTANIYGAGQPEHRFIPHAFATLRRGEKLALDGGGNTLRGWMHVRDACEATYLLCKSGKIGETYHIAPRGVLTTKAIAQMICSQLGLLHHEVLEDRPDRLGKDIAYIMDSSKIRALGWSEKITLTEGLGEYGGNSRS
jgi:dTDP-glucose 4,6-dehydratase